MGAPETTNESGESVRLEAGGVLHIDDLTGSQRPFITTFSFNGKIDVVKSKTTANVMKHSPRVNAKWLIVLVT